MTATLLAIDDSKTMRKVLEITFAGEDFRTVLSENASDALAKLRSERPAVVLLDAILGETNGYDLCQRIKAEAPQVGVIILSSKQHPYDRARGTAAGADDFIDKPFDTQVLLDKATSLTQKLADAPAPVPAAAPVVQRPAPPAPAPRMTAPSVTATSTPQATVKFGAVAQPQSTEHKTAVAAHPVPAAAPAVSHPTAATSIAGAVAQTGIEGKLYGMGLTKEQVAGVLAISKDVLEQVVWEVVPVLAETLIREEIQRLTAE